MLAGQRRPSTVGPFLSSRASHPLVACFHGRHHALGVAISLSAAIFASKISRTARSFRPVTHCGAITPLPTPESRIRPATPSILIPHPPLDSGHATYEPPSTNVLPTHSAGSPDASAEPPSQFTLTPAIYPCEARLPVAYFIFFEFV